MRATRDSRWVSSVICCAAIACASGLLSSPALAEEPRGPISQAGLGLGSIAASIVYTPAKLLYAGAGAVIGVGAFAASGGRKDVFWEIVNPSVGGDYVVTPEHLLRERRLAFMGDLPDPEPEPRDDRAADRSDDRRYEADRYEERRRRSDDRRPDDRRRYDRAADGR
jgi:hypothetical protein